MVRLFIFNALFSSEHASVITAQVNLITLKLQTNRLLTSQYVNTM